MHSSEFTSLKSSKEEEQKWSSGKLIGCFIGLMAVCALLMVSIQSGQMQHDVGTGYFFRSLKKMKYLCVCVFFLHAYGYQQILWKMFKQIKIINCKVRNSEEVPKQNPIFIPTAVWILQYGSRKLFWFFLIFFLCFPVSAIDEIDEMKENQNVEIPALGEEVPTILQQAEDVSAVHASPLGMEFSGLLEVLSTCEFTFNILFLFVVSLETFGYVFCSDIFFCFFVILTLFFSIHSQTSMLDQQLWQRCWLSTHSLSI